MIRAPSDPCRHDSNDAHLLRAHEPAGLAPGRNPLPCSEMESPRSGGQRTGDPTPAQGTKGHVPAQGADSAVPSKARAGRESRGAVVEKGSRAFIPALAEGPPKPHLPGASRWDLREMNGRCQVKKTSYGAEGELCAQQLVSWEGSMDTGHTEEVRA